MAEARGVPITIDGKLVGVEIICDKAGDELSEHAHERATIHWTVCTLGSFEMFGREAIDGKILKAGDKANWRIGEVHGFRAREDDSRMVNILKNP